MMDIQSTDKKNSHDKISINGLGLGEGDSTTVERERCVNHHTWRELRALQLRSRWRSRLILKSAAPSDVTRACGVPGNTNVRTRAGRKEDAVSERERWGRRNGQRAMKSRRE